MWWTDGYVLGRCITGQSFELFNQMGLVVIPAYITQCR